MKTYFSAILLAMLSVGITTQAIAQSSPVLVIPGGHAAIPKPKPPIAQPRLPSRAQCNLAGKIRPCSSCVTKSWKLSPIRSGYVCR